jgi:hypothetical protein
MITQEVPQEPFWRTDWEGYIEKHGWKLTEIASPPPIRQDKRGNPGRFIAKALMIAEVLSTLLFGINPSPQEILASQIQATPIISPASRIPGLAFVPFEVNVTGIPFIPTASRCLSTPKNYDHLPLTPPLYEDPEVEVLSQHIFQRYQIPVVLFNDNHSLVKSGQEVPQHEHKEILTQIIKSLAKYPPQYLRDLQIRRFSVLDDLGIRNPVNNTLTIGLAYTDKRHIYVTKRADMASITDHELDHQRVAKFCYSEVDKDRVSDIDNTDIQYYGDDWVRAQTLPSGIWDKYQLKNADERTARNHEGQMNANTSFKEALQRDDHLYHDVIALRQEIFFINEEMDSGYWTVIDQDPSLITEEYWDRYRLSR